MATAAATASATTTTTTAATATATTVLLLLLLLLLQTTTTTISTQMFHSKDPVAENEAMSPAIRVSLGGEAGLACCVSLPRWGSCWRCSRSIVSWCCLSLFRPVVAVLK